MKRIVRYQTEISGESVFFLNHKNSAGGTGGVGTVTREMLKNHPKITYVYNDEDVDNTGGVPNHNINLPRGMSKGLHGIYSKLYLWPVLHLMDAEVHGDALRSARLDYLKAVSEYASRAVAYAKQKSSNVRRQYWINDYVLLGSIAEIRELDPSSLIIFSFRTSFGNSSQAPLFDKEDLKVISKNLLKADIVTVHRKSDKENIINILNTLKLNIKVVPMGGNKQYRRSLLNTEESHTAMLGISQKYPDIKRIISISRFEMSKGLDYELDLIEGLLAKYPEMIKRFVFIRYSYLSAQKRHTKIYSDYLSHIEGRVEKINLGYSLDGWSPIVSSLDKKLNDAEVNGVLSASDALLVASYADGFNHLTIEYIYSRGLKGACLLMGDIGARDYLRGADLLTHSKGLDVEILAKAIMRRGPLAALRAYRLRRSAGRLSAKKWSTTILKEADRLRRSIYG